MGDDDNQIDGVFQFIDRLGHCLSRVAELEIGNARSQRHAAGVMPDNPDDAQPDAVALQDHVWTAVAKVGPLVIDIGPQNREADTVHETSKISRAVIKLVIADSQGVVTDGVHHFHQRFALGQEREGAGEHVSGIEQKSSFLASSNALGQGRELSGAAQLGGPGQPIGRYGSKAL